MYSTITVARILGCARRTVQKWYQYLGLQKPEGMRDYQISEEDLGRIRELLQPKIGRPKKGQ